MQPVVIVGGGISGLSAAYYLSKLSKLHNRSIGKIILIDSSNRFGGWVDTFKNKNGVLHELGPRSLRKAGKSGENTLQLINELNITDDVIIKSSKDPNVGNRYIATSNGLAKAPSKLLNLIFKQRPFTKPMYKYMIDELKTPKLDLTNQSLDYLEEFDRTMIKNNEKLLNEQLEDISIHKFIRLRLGDEIADYLIDPLLRGITSGNARTLSARSMFEEIFFNERNFGGIIRGSYMKSRMESKFRAKQKMSKTDITNDQQELPEKLKKIRSGVIWSFKEGIVQLPNSLIENLSNDSNVELRLNNSLKDFNLNENGQLILNIENEQKQNYQLTSDHVFFSLNAIDLTKSIPNDKNLNLFKTTLNSIKSTNVATISMEMNKKNLLNKYPGFGFLIPSHVNSSILGVVFDSLVFPELDNSNEITRLSVMAGGDWFNELTKSNGELDESKLIEKSIEVLYKYLEIKDDPSFLKINVLKNCIPQYRVGHYLKLKLLNKEIDEQNLRLSLIGSSYWGVSLNDCIYNSRLKVENYLNNLTS